MRIWIINPFDNLPMEGFRPQRYWLMARAFVAAGDDVVYWTSDFSHAEKQKRRLERENEEKGIDIRFIPSKPYGKNISLERISSHWKLARDWKRLASECAEKPDIIIASTPPLGLCDKAREFAKESRAFFVSDIMDAWPETFERIAPRWALFPLRRIAKRIYNSADAISAVAKRYIALAKSYGARAPMRLAYHGIELEEKIELVSGKRGDGALRLCYIGSMGKSYDLETLVDAVKGFDGVELSIAGSGPKEAALRKRSEGFANIKFLGYLDNAKMKELLAKCDVGVIPMFPDSCVGVPYKLADYAMARLAIVESLGGETQELIERYGAGFHYEPRDIESLRAALDKIRLGRIASFDKEGFLKEFDSSRIMPQYASWAKNLAQAKKEASCRN